MFCFKNNVSSKLKKQKFKINIPRHIKPIINNLERQIKNNSFETVFIVDRKTGKIVLEKTGTKNQTIFNNWEVLKLKFRKLRNKRDISIHNHPKYNNPLSNNNNPLTKNDILLGLSYNFSEIRAIDSLGRIHIMEIPPKIKYSNSKIDLANHKTLLESISYTKKTENFENVKVIKIPDFIYNKFYIPKYRKAKKLLETEIGVKFRDVLLPEK